MKIVNHDIRTSGPNWLRLSQLYSSRALCITEPEDIVQLHINLRPQWSAIQAHYEKVGLSFTRQVIWDTRLERTRDYPDHKLSAFFFGEREHLFRPDARRREITEFLNSKNNLIKYSREMGVPVPETHCFDRTSSAKTLTNKFNYPCYLKPATSMSGLGIFRCTTPNELGRALSKLHPDIPIQIQNEVKADRFLSFQYIVKNGRLDRLLMSEQIMSGNAHNGNRVPACCEPWSVLDSLAESVAAKGMQDIFAFDVAMINDAGEMKFYVLECNPRFTAASYPALVAKKIHATHWSTAIVQTSQRDLQTIDFADIEYDPARLDGVILINWGSIIRGKLMIMLVGTEVRQEALLYEFKQRISAQGAARFRPGMIVTPQHIERVTAGRSANLENGEFTGFTNNLRQSKGRHMKSTPASIECETPGPDLVKPVIWTGRDLSAATGGTWIFGAEESVQATGVWYTLSRIQPGDLFITTNPDYWGDHFAFSGSDEKLQELANRGAVAVITDHTPVGPRHHNLPVLLVENTRKALDALGRYARKRSKGKIVCVTGSVGKSSTKEMLRFVLGCQDITSGSSGNQNSVVGVPLSLAQARPDAAYGVFENSAGPKRKVQMIEPHVVIITEIQEDHLDVYKTLEGVADAKAKMFDALLPGGTAILNRDNPLYARLLAAAQTKKVSRIVTFGRHQNADVRAVSSKMDATGSYIQATIHGNPVSYRLAQPGAHMIMNSLAALAAVEAVGANVIQAAEDLGKYSGLEQRSMRHRIQIADGYFDIIDDAFSANPASVRAGLELLGLLPLKPEGRRIVVLGEIKELGENSAAIHASLADAVLAAKVDKIFTIGDDMLPLRAALPKEMLADHGNIGTALVEAVASTVRQGDVILVKGSRRVPENTIPVIKALMEKGVEVSVEESPVIPIDPIDSSLPVASAPVRKQDKTSLDILFVGDTDFGESYQSRNEKNGRGNILRDKGYDYPLMKMRPILSQADVVIANLETPLTDISSSPYEGKKGYLHWSDIFKSPDQLLKSNIRVVSLANNHTLDFGLRGLEQTFDALHRVGIRYFGAGRSAAEAIRPLMVEIQVSGHQFKMAVVGVFENRKSYKNNYSWYAKDDKAGVAIYDEHTLHLIRELKQSDPSLLVVAYPHWGENYQSKAAHQEKMANDILEAGADLILGHGAHALQEIEYRQGRWIVYSLGNFMFNSPGRYSKTNAPPYGLVAKLLISGENNELRRLLRLFPIFTDNRKTGYQSRFVTESEFEEVFCLLTAKDAASSQRIVKGKDEFGYYLELIISVSGSIPLVSAETRQDSGNKDVALSGAIKLAEYVNEHGRFRYRFDAITGADLSGYNVLRHCGSVWAIMEVYQAFPEQDVIYQASHRATTYILNEFLKYIPDYRYACIVEDGVIKLGGNALAILALLAVYKVSREPILLTVAESIGASIERDRTPDGDFVHKTYMATGKISQFRSEYYTGEALLALLALYEASGDGRWLDIVSKSENSLMKKDYGVREQSHWMLYALERLCRYHWNDAYAQHACKITQNILTHPAYLSTDRSTPTACRSEGLLAFVRLVDNSAADAGFMDLRQRSMIAVERNLIEQRRFRQNDGVFVRGGGGARNSEVRIDYIQHNISSFLYYHLLTKR